MARFLRYQFPAFVWAVLIFVSSALPTIFFDRFGVVYPWAPKAVHVFFFFLLCFFLNRALQALPPSTFLARWSIPMSVLFCLMFGTLDEVHQIFVPSRHPRLSDVGLDLSGALLMGAALWTWDRVRSLHREQVVR